MAARFSDAFLSSLLDMPSRLELWQSVVRHCGVEAMAEVGVWRGDFAAHILRHCPAIQRYYLLDPWQHLPDWNKPANVPQEDFEPIYEEAMEKTRFAAGRIVVLRGRTAEVADDIPDESLDLVYIDGDHTLRGITIDLIRMLPKVKPGGLIAGDDFTHTPWQHKANFEPTLVCPFAVYFAEAMGLPIIGLPHKQFVIEKVSGGESGFRDLTGNYSDLSLNKLHPSQIPKSKQL